MEKVEGDQLFFYRCHHMPHKYLSLGIASSFASSTCSFIIFPRVLVSRLPGPIKVICISKSRMGAKLLGIETFARNYSDSGVFFDCALFSKDPPK